VRKGDISNELPRRILVTTDIIMDVEMTVKRRLLVIPSVKINKKFKRDALSYLYVFTSRAGVTLELVSFDLTDADLEESMEMLDRMGTNPFRYYTAYESDKHLVSELPYRPEVVGVVDVDSRLLRYGHWGRTFADLQ
jgi:hypothetical protein